MSPDGFSRALCGSLSSLAWVSPGGWCLSGSSQSSSLGAEPPSFFPFSWRIILPHCIIFLLHKSLIQTSSNNLLNYCILCSSGNGEEPSLAACICWAGLTERSLPTACRTSAHTWAVALLMRVAPSLRCRLQMREQIAVEPLPEDPSAQHGASCFTESKPTFHGHASLRLFCHLTQNVSTDHFSTKAYQARQEASADKLFTVFNYLRTDLLNFLVT